MSWRKDPTDPQGVAVQLGPQLGALPARGTLQRRSVDVDQMHPSKCVANARDPDRCGFPRRAGRAVRPSPRSTGGEGQDLGVSRAVASVAPPKLERVLVASLSACWARSKSAARPSTAFRTASKMNDLSRQNRVRAAAKKRHH